VCDPGETPCACALDCGVATPGEYACSDGIDNDCDGAIDCADAECAAPLPAPPSGSPDLAAEWTETGVRLSWSALSGTTGYDVVRGDLDLLASGAGLETSTLDCVADDLQQAATLVPPEAGNRWFLVRGVACAGPGSYDSGGAGQTSSRDPAIAAAGGCP